MASLSNTKARGEVVKRLRRVEGQLRGVIRMIEEGCHTVNTIRNPVPMSGKLVHNGREFEVKTQLEKG